VVADVTLVVFDLQVNNPDVFSHAAGVSELFATLLTSNKLVPFLVCLVKRVNPDLFVVGCLMRMKFAEMLFVKFVRWIFLVALITEKCTRVFVQKTV